MQSSTIKGTIKGTIKTPCNVDSHTTAQLTIQDNELIVESFFKETGKKNKRNEEHAKFAIYDTVISMKPLSICVPTFNRKALLERLIKNVIQETKTCRADVELCISDNKSTDGTGDMVRRYVKRYAFISYHCNDENIGASRNVIQVMEHAVGTHCWFIGDDDLFEPGAIAHVVALLKSGAEYVMPTFRRPGEQQSSAGYAHTMIERGSDAWRELAGDVWNISYLGTHVVPRAAALRTRKAMVAAVGFPHLAMFLRARTSCKRIHRVTTPCILQESDGVFPTSEKIALLFVQLLPIVLKSARSEKAMTREEYTLAMRNVGRHLATHLLPILIVVFRNRDDLRKGAAIATASYTRHFEGTQENTGALRMCMSIIRHPVLLIPIAYLGKLAFEILFVRAGNLVRKRKMMSPWSAQRSSKGMTEIST